MFIYRFNVLFKKKQPSFIDLAEVLRRTQETENRPMAAIHGGPMTA